MSPELTKNRTLLRFCVDISPHLLGWAVLNNNVALVDLILDKKLLTLICFMHFELLAFPFVLRSKALILSRYKNKASILYPCACMKYLAHRI